MKFRRFGVVIATAVAATMVSCGENMISYAAVESTGVSKIVSGFVKQSVNELKNAAENFVKTETPDMADDEQLVLQSADEQGESTEPAEKVEPKGISYSEADVVALAQIMHSEAGGIQSQTEQACVAWCVLNRVDNGWGSIQSVLRAPYQFAFYDGIAVRDDLYTLATDVLRRWELEKSGEMNSGRVLPKEYMYFHGDGVHNYFKTSSDGGTYWDYHLETPYNS